MPIHQPFIRLPVWLRRVLTLLAVVLLASLLTHWRQNASTYATGFWDTGSQPLVFGRMLQMENHQSAPGGFMGVYTQEWSDGQNRTWFRENTPVNAEDFQAYTHQSGLQGWAFGLLNRAFRLVQPSGETRETWLYTVTASCFTQPSCCWRWLPGGRQARRLRWSGCWPLCLPPGPSGV